MPEPQDRDTAAQDRAEERVTPTEDNPRLVLLTLPAAEFRMAPFRARELGCELIRVADEIVSGGHHAR